MVQAHTCCWLVASLAAPWPSACCSSSCSCCCSSRIMCSTRRTMLPMASSASGNAQAGNRQGVRARQWHGCALKCQTGSIRHTRHTHASHQQRRHLPTGLAACSLVPTVRTSSIRLAASTCRCVVISSRITSAVFFAHANDPCTCLSGAWGGGAVVGAAGGRGPATGRGSSRATGRRTACTRSPPPKLRTVLLNEITEVHGCCWLWHRRRRAMLLLPRCQEWRLNSRPACARHLFQGCKAAAAKL